MFSQFIGNVPTWLSQTVNTWLLWPFGWPYGHPDLTVSSASHIHGGWPERFIDRIFFWDSDHCKKSFLKDVQFAVDVIRWYEERNTKG